MARDAPPEHHAAVLAGAEIAAAPWRMARAAMFSRPWPVIAVALAVRAAGPTPVVGDRDGEAVVADEDRDVDVACVGVPDHVCQRLAQRGDRVGHCGVVETRVERSVDEHPGLEAQRLDSLSITLSSWCRGPLCELREPSSSKIAERMYFMVRSRSSTASSIREAAAAGSLPTTQTVLCSARPVANKRWITVSCSSRAMRSRSSRCADGSRPIVCPCPATSQGAKVP